MNAISLKTTKFQEIFEQLKLTLNGNLSTKANEYELQLENGFGEGIITGTKLKGGISYLEFDVNFTEDFQLIFDPIENNPIYFAYCFEGHLNYGCGMNGSTQRLENFQTAILASELCEEHILEFKKGVKVKISIITVNTAKDAIGTTNNNILKQELRQTFFNKENEEAANLVYIGSYNLKIADKIRQLNSIQEKGIARSLFFEGIVHIILALEIQQHSEDVKNNGHHLSSLSKTEMSKIADLSLFIQNYSEIPMSIKYLSNKSGLSPNKLQEGFRSMHNRTVTDYIREIRIQNAEKLIKNSDMNISEVVYSIGFTSRSYFSKIFKQKYKCSPKQYKINQRRLMQTA